MPDRDALLAQIRVFESDFDKAQGQLRTISSAWSGVIIAATALMTVNSFSEPTSPEKKELFLYVIQTVCLFGSIGVFAFWFVDQRVYQRLLHSVFAYGLYEEFKQPAGPQIRSAMWIGNLDVTADLGNFYLAQLLAFPFLSGAIVTAFSKFAGIAIDGHLGMLIAHASIALGLWWFSSQWPSLEGLIERLYPDLADALPRRTTTDRDAEAIAWKKRVRGEGADDPPADHGRRRASRRVS